MIHLLMIILLIGCGQTKLTEKETKVVQVEGKNGSSCSAEQVETGAVINCTDGSSAVINNGITPTSPENGIDGSSCTTEQLDTGILVTCEDGTSSVITKGENGINGEDGINATPTEPIYVGYFCSRVVLKISNLFYVIHGNLTLLSTSWFKISASCSIRNLEGIIETK